MIATAPCRANALRCRPTNERVRFGREREKLTRRLERDAKALFAFYQYGVLHRCVRLHWGFLDEMFPVDWALPGEPSLYDILDEGKKVGAPVDLVVGSAPGWSDPWSRAHRGFVIEVEPWQVTVSLNDVVCRFDRREIQAARIARGPDGT